MTERDIGQTDFPYGIDEVDALQLAALDNCTAGDQKCGTFAPRNPGSPKQTGALARIDRQFDFHDEGAARRVGRGNNLGDFPLEFDAAERVKSHRDSLAHTNNRNVPGGSAWL